MNIPDVDVYVKVATGLLGVAFPILFQVISKLDDKYASVLIVELLDNEIEKKWFLRLLISSLFFIFLWSLKLPPLFNLEGILIENSAAFLILLSTTLLVFCFFFFVRKIMIYYTPAKFIRYLKFRDSKADQGDFRYFKALSDVLILSIQKQNENISQTLSGYFYDCFNEIRRNSEGKPVEYPAAFYSVVYKSIEELAILKNKKNSSLEYLTAGSIWLLGEFQGHEISDATYVWLWRNIVLSVSYERDDMVLAHWGSAHQYFSVQLKPIPYEYDFDNLEVSNQSVIDKRNKERQRFLEFHYALGGLLLYKQRYRCLEKCFSYTQSWPPKYELLPDSMDVIFQQYMDLNDDYNPDFSWISSKYYFPDQTGIEANRIIKRWISSYLAVLFLREYTIVPHLVFMNPLAPPTLPESQSEKRQWVEKLDFFRKLVSENLDNTPLIEALDFKFLNREWCNKEKKTFPLEFIDELVADLKSQYATDAINLPIADKRRNEFISATQKIIEKAFELINSISNPTMISEDFNCWYINGLTMVQNKDAFTENPESHYVDYDSFLAGEVSKQIKDKLANTFLINKTHSYLLQTQDIFKAIDSKIGVDEDDIIVSFGLIRDGNLSRFDAKGLAVNKYKDTTIISLPSLGTLGESLFILKKDDLPSIVPKEVADDVIEKYSLARISDQINLFASVLDLNLAPDEMRKEYSRNRSEGDLRKSVLLSIIFLAEIRWKKNVKMIQLIRYSEYGQKGLPNSLNDIVNS